MAKVVPRLSIASSLAVLSALVALSCSGSPKKADLADAGPSPPPDAGPHPVGPAVDVLTQHNDIGRTGANLAETVLTTSNVGGASFGLRFKRAVDDQIYAQPLIVSGLDLPGAGKRNVLFVATVGDSVYAFDADDAAAGQPLWQRSLLEDGEQPPANSDMTGACGGSYTDYSGHIGIVSTPVIDRAAGTMYVVARSQKNGVFSQRFHALDLRDGSERPGSPVTITASVPGDGDGSEAGTIQFDPQKQNQRAALLLVGGVVYVAWASHCDWGPYHGWIVGYDAHTLQQVLVYNTTPQGGAAGIWQSGQGLSSDGTSIYAVTGNGTVGTGKDPSALVNRGESFLKLSRNGKTLEVQSWFTPYNYDALEAGDLDLGSAGLLLVPGTHLAVSGGKGGWLYVVDRDHMGGLSQNGSDDNIVQSFVLNEPQHLHGSPVYWKGPNGGRVYTWAEEDFLKSFPVLTEAYQPGSKVLDAEHASKSGFRADLGMPGAMLSISANGDKAGTGVVWASLPESGDANQAVQPGILRAFDASDMTHELWNSTAKPSDSCGDFAKFSNPTIANGKVYLASFSNQVCVYGL